MTAVLTGIKVAVITMSLAVSTGEVTYYSIEENAFTQEYQGQAYVEIESGNICLNEDCSAFVGGAL